MSDTQQLIQLIENILQPNDKDLREQSEQALVNLRTQRPNELMIAFLTILEHPGKIQARNFAATQLRLCLSDFSPATYTNLWPNIMPENQNAIKIKLFQIIYKQQDASMKRHIGDTLGQIAGSMISHQLDSWPEFKQHVWTLFQDSNILSNLAAFGILQTFFSFAPDYFKDNSNDLYALFKAALLHENYKLKLAALKCFSAYLEVLQNKKHSQFEQIILSIYEAVYLLLLNDNSNEEGLEVLSDMCEIQPKFFKRKFGELNELMKKIFQIPKLQSGIKRMTTQILLDYSQKYPAIFRKKKQYLNNLIEMIFSHMIQIDSKITEEWKKPPQGHSDDMQDDNDFETTRFGMGAVDRLIYSVGQQQLLPILSQTIQKMLVQNDWRYKYTAIMALSQIGEYIDQPDKISSIMMMIASFLKDQNPMLRYASCHAIGQISDDMQPKFQERYGQQLYPLLVDMLNDQIPRVVSHVCAAFTNFLEGMTYVKIQSRLEQLMNMLIYHSTNGISLVKQSAVNAISSVAQVCKEKFEKYFPKVIQLLFLIFENHNGKQYKLLKGQCIQTLTIIAESIGGQMFKPVAQKLIHLMINIQNSPFEQNDPQKTYLLAGWQRLCLIYGQQLAMYLDNILPSLFRLVQNVINNELQLVKNPELKQKEDIQKQQTDGNINTFETQQAEVAISMLNVFIDKLKQMYGPYVEKTVHLLCTIINDHPNQDVKEQACKCLPNLISAVKNTNKNVAIDMAKYFMDTLVKSIENEFDTDITIVELQTLKNVLDELNLCFLTEAQVSAFSQKILALLKSSDQKKMHSTAYINQNPDEVDDEEKQMIGEEIKIQEQVQVAISQLIGSLFKTHKDMTMQLANFLITNILPKSFQVNQSENMHKFGIFLIDDLVQFLGYQRLHDKWLSFGEVLVKFSSEKSCILRQAACYGLGIFAQSTPKQVINAGYVNLWLNSLVFAAKIQKGAQKQKTYGNCKDNAVSSIGKILKIHGSFVDSAPYLSYWLSCLPLRHDKPEAQFMHQFLMDILMSSPDAILGTDQNHKLGNYQRIIGIIADINLNPKITNQEIKKKVKIYLQSLQGNQFFSKNMNNIWGTLNEKQKKQLSQLIK